MNGDLNRADLVIRNVRVFNSYFKCFNDADVYVKDGKFLYIDQKRCDEVTADREIDGLGRYMIPGLIDIHMHIESSLVTPESFCNYTARNGLTTIVSEPHEIANVCGKEGIKAMIRSGENSPYDCFYAIPSNVPIMPKEYETSGDTITCSDMLELKSEKGIICLGEVMNFREIIRENDSEVAKFIDIVHKEDPYYVLEGHCPALKDAELARFLYLGIGSDHCEHDIEEIRQRFANGMFVQIQDLMLKKEVIDFIVENNLYEYFSFVTDDTFPDVLCERGHVDALIRKAIGFGMKPEMAIYSTTFTPARRMNLTDRGVIAPGKLADFVLLDDPYKFNILQTYKKGERIFDINDPADEREDYTLGEQFFNTVKLSKPDLDLFKVNVGGSDRKVTVKVMDVLPDTNRTYEKHVDMEVKDGLLQWKESGCMLTMVFERHGHNGSIGYGFSTGSCITKGAVASSYSHDSHNLIVMGDNEADMKLAVDTIIEENGGICCVEKGNVIANMALPVAGLLTTKSVVKTAQEFRKLREGFASLGYRHYNTVMNFCLLSLTCISQLKLTDQGYMDTDRLEMVPMLVGEDN